MWAMKVLRKPLGNTDVFQGLRATMTNKIFRSRDTQAVTYSLPAKFYNIFEITSSMFDMFSKLDVKLKLENSLEICGY